MYKKLSLWFLGKSGKFCSCANTHINILVQFFAVPVSVALLIHVTSVLDQITLDHGHGYGPCFQQRRLFIFAKLHPKNFCLSFKINWMCQQIFHLTDLNTHWKWKFSKLKIFFHSFINWSTKTNNPTQAQFQGLSLCFISLNKCSHYSRNNKNSIGNGRQFNFKWTICRVGRSNFYSLLTLLSFKSGAQCFVIIMSLYIGNNNIGFVYIIRYFNGVCMQWNFITVIIKCY